MSLISIQCFLYSNPILQGIKFDLSIPCMLSILEMSRTLLNKRVGLTLSVVAFTDILWFKDGNKWSDFEEVIQTSSVLKEWLFNFFLFLGMAIFYLSKTNLNE